MGTTKDRHLYVSGNPTQRCSRRPCWAQDAVGGAMGYVFAEESDIERARLTGLEATFDPITTDVLARLGVGPGWRCAEVGAGGGSIVRWLADRVGPTGQVVATDIDIRYLATVDAPNV